MNADRYRFKLGDFECLAILDWIGSRSAEFFFPNVPHSLLKAENINPEAVSSPGTCLAVNTGAYWVLLDTGLGFAWEDGSHLAQILEEEDIQPCHIILTHLDLDHYAGLISPDQIPAFLGATVHICRDAWELFTSESYYKKYPHEYDRREHLSVIKDQVQLVDCTGEIMHGFTMIPLPGHRDHHMGIEVESNGEKLLFAADVVCHPLHIKHLDWNCGADTDHELARETRIKFAQMTSENGCLVLPFHFEFPALGHVVQNGDGWKWQPLEI